jgi:hypothetical protein
MPDLPTILRCLSASAPTATAAPALAPVHWRRGVFVIPIRAFRTVLVTLVNRPQQADQIVTVEVPIGKCHWVASGKSNDVVLAQLEEALANLLVPSVQ